MTLRSCVAILSLFTVVSCGRVRLLDDANGDGGPVPAADAVTAGLLFEHGTVRHGPLPETTDDSFYVVEPDPYPVLELVPGGSDTLDFELGGRWQDVRATLLLIEGASSYIEVPISGAEQSSVTFSVAESICDQVCAQRYTLWLDQTLQNSDGDIGDWRRAARLELDCTERGVHALQCDGVPSGEGDGDGDGDDDIVIDAGGGVGGSVGGEGGFGGFIETGGSGGSVAGTGGTEPTDGVCFSNHLEENITCPDALGPFNGSCSPRGECCQRSSNSAKIAQLGPDDPLVLEYRVATNNAINHPLSITLPILQMVAAERARTCAGDQCRLWRFTQPRAGGMPVAGDGVSELGIGRYNCDGTYSFYSETAAPSRPVEGLTDASRWAIRSSAATIEPTLEGADRAHNRWANDPNQRLSCAPYFLPGTQTVDWEECSAGFEILEFDTSLRGEDCMGAWNGSSWVTPGRFQTFVPIASNNLDIIDSIGQTYCQLLSFSVLMPADRDTDCLALPRCMPGTDGCKYVRLPDSLCPDTDAERSNFRCHLGAQGNPNQDDDYPSDTAINCSADAPSSPLDPDIDPSVSKGQCCDPLGAGTSGLPACNAFRMLYQYAASAAEITSSVANDLPPVCAN